ncbi:MAG: hypothetical protein AB8F74_23315 [Saprospiraceae bacterium]
MNKKNFIVLIGFCTILSITELKAQVGIGTENPTNTLHIKPLDSDEDPLRIENLNEIMQGDTALLVLDPATGVVRYMLIDSLFALIPKYDDPDSDPTNELQNALEVPIEPNLDLDNNGLPEQNLHQAIWVLGQKLPKGTYKSISEARDAGLNDGDSFLADPKGIFGCSGCVITLHPGMN